MSRIYRDLGKPFQLVFTIQLPLVLDRVSLVIQADLRVLSREEVLFKRKGNKVSLTSVLMMNLISKSRLNLRRV